MNHTKLEDASDDIKLAVDLICLLERNEIAPETVLKALEIIKTDYEIKLSQDQHPHSKDNESD